MAKDLHEYLEKNNILNAGWTEFKFIIYKGNLKHGGYECFGYTDFDRLEIVLSAGKVSDPVPESARKLTALHEIFHVIADMSGFSAEEEVKGLLPPTSNEALVERMSKGLMTVLKLNPELFKIIFSYE